MRLCIIGNGFDKHHKLPTSYDDFRNWMTENHLHKPCKVENYFPNGKDELWKSFEANLVKFDSEAYRKRELPNSVEGKTLNAPSKREICLPAIWIRWIRRCLRLWVSFLEESINIQKKDIVGSPHMMSLDKNALYLSFNYTTTLETWYDIDETRVYHIHGKYGDRRDQLILGGLTDERNYFERQPSNKGETFYPEIATENGLVDAVKSFEKPVEAIISSELFKGFLGKLKNTDVVDIMGFSFGDVDMRYIEEICKALKQTNPNCKWRCSWFSDYEHDDFKQKIRNLVGREPDMFRIEDYSSDMRNKGHLK